MELPQPRKRSFGTQGRKPTHDFLSLYSPAHQDPCAPSGGSYIETHNFLQPLERVVAKEGKSLPPVPPTTVEHILPGGIGSYSISHISCINQNQNQMMPKPEGVLITATEAQSSGSDRNESKFCSPSAQKNQSFVDMLKSGKNTQDEDDEEEEVFVIKKEPSSHYKIDTTHHEQKPNTLRSKHSATEQRRRSKINDRFSMLRELIPRGDKKRDKASFLLEVIQYVQFLQQKVHKYEDSCREWKNKQPTTIMPWKNQRPTEDQQHQNGVSTPPLPYTPNLNENKCNSSLNLPKKGQNILSCDESMKEIGRLTNKPSSFPSPLQPPVCGSTSVTAPITSNLASNTGSELWQGRSCTTDCSGDKLKDDELTIESGTISISTIYSQGLLNTLTQALQSSGVDLSEANILVQIDLGKRANKTTSTPLLQKKEVAAIDARSRLASTREDKSDKALKRFKTTRN